MQEKVILREINKKTRKPLGPNPITFPVWTSGSSLSEGTIHRTKTPVRPEERGKGYKHKSLVILSIRKRLQDEIKLRKQQKDKTICELPETGS